MTARCLVCTAPGVAVTKHGHRCYCLRHVPYGVVLYALDSQRSWLIGGAS